jgi:hypothetical protein
MSWNYRVIKQTSKLGEDWYEFREVYYTKSGKIDMWTARSAEPHGGSLEDLKWGLIQMLEALEKPVLTEVKRGKKEYLEEVS